MNGQHQDYPHLKNAPITEAIIDLRVRLPGSFQIAGFAGVHSQFKTEYPHAEEKKLLEHHFQQTIGKPPNFDVKDLGVVGTFFHSVDKKQVVQFRRDGFTFNRLNPYTSWNEVFHEASRLWSFYSQISKPEYITRIAVRYINRLNLPGTHLAFNEYLTAPPNIPETVPQLTSEFITRITIQDPETNIAANITQALEPPLKEGYIPVILDIDVFHQNVGDLMPDTVMGKFEQLREMKNRIFFGSLTQKAIVLFQ